MLSAAMLDFLEQLGAHNTKEWMDANRNRYQDIRKQYLGFAADCIVLYEGIDPLFHAMKPKDVVFRINRDTRFSKDKSPYKNWMSVYLAPGGKNRELIGPYIHIQPGNQSFIGGGLWMPQSRVLRAFRDYVAVHYKKFAQILADPDLVNFFGQLEVKKLKTSPKGFPKNHPATQYLQYTSFVFHRQFSDEEVLNPGFMDVCQQAMRLQLDFNTYINTAIELGRPVDDTEIFD